MNTSKLKQMKIARRHKRIRAVISGTKERPRVSVFRSNKYISAQLIDDVKGHTFAQATAADPKVAGQDLAKKAKALKIEKVVFDRGGYLYAGKIKMLAEALREGGLIF